MMRPVATIAALLGLAAAPAAADEAAERHQRFARGFEQLLELGLPDTEGARWDKAPDELGVSPFLENWNYPFARKPRGSGWHREDGGWIEFGGPTTVTPETPSESDADADKEDAGPLGFLQRMAEKYEENHPRPEGEKPPPRPEPTPLIERDVEMLIEVLPKVAEELNQQLEYGRDEAVGRTLLFAAQVHAAGETELAARLAEALFDAIPDHTSVVDAAVRQLADHQLQQVTERFFDEHDWQAYADSLAELASRFPRGWNGRLAIALLLPEVEARARGEGLPPLEGEIDPRALAALETLLAPPPERPEPDPNQIPGLPDGIRFEDLPAAHQRMLMEQMQFGGRQANDSLWLLARNETDSPLARLSNLGMNAVPALAAALEIDTLTSLPKPAQGSSHYWSSRESMAERAQRFFDQMERPESLGEVAARMLLAVLPDTRSEGIDASSGAMILRQRALDFHREHGDKSPLELAGFYLQLEDPNQVQRAANFLLDPPDAAKDRVFEQATLAAPSRLFLLGPVERYLQARGAERRSFHDQFAERLREDVEDLGDADSNQPLDPFAAPRSGAIQFFGGYGGVDGYLGTLAVHVGAADLEELVIAAVGADEEPPAGSLEALANAAASAPLEQLVSHFGRHLPAAGPERLAELLAHFSFQFQPRDRTPVPAEAIANWRQLIESTEPLPDRPELVGWFRVNGVETLGAAAATLLESWLTEDFSTRINMTRAVHAGGDSTSELLLARVRARLDGEEPPDFPDASRVDESRREEIIALAKERRGVERHRAILALDPDERAFWYEWRSGLQDGAEHPELAADRTTLVTDSAAPTMFGTRRDGEWLDTLGLTIGARLELETLERVATLLLTEEDQAVMISLDPHPLGTGLQRAGYRYANFTEHPSSDYFSYELREADPDADAIVILRAAGLQRSMHWLLKNDEVVAPEGGEDALEALGESLRAETVEAAAAHLIRFSRSHLDPESE